MKKVVVKKKITTDLVLDLYEKAKKLDGEEQEKLMKTVKLLSKNIGSYLAR